MKIAARRLVSKLQAALLVCTLVVSVFSMLFAFPGTAYAASTGWVLAGAGANNADAGNVVWGTPGNITASDNSRSKATPVKNETTQYLHAISFGHSLPAGATVTGVEVRIERQKDTSAGTLVDHTVQLIKGGTRQGDNNADLVTSWPGSDTNADYGGAADMWGLTLTKADVEAADFGVALRVEETADDKAGVLVDSIWTNIHYTTAPDAPTALTTTSNTGSVGLSWTAPGSAGLETYGIWRNTVSFTTSDDAILLASIATTSTTYSDNSTSHGTTYYYGVTATNASATSSLSNIRASGSNSGRVIRLKGGVKLKGSRLR